jgi:flagellar L-ring protein precursor FlgH
MRRMHIVIGVLCIALSGDAALGQSSALYPAEEPHRSVFPPTTPAEGLAPARVRVSFMAVSPPPERIYGVNDIVEIIIRESTSAQMDASLETEKELDFSGEITEFPNLNLRQLLELHFKPNNITDPLKLEANYENEFEGGGSLERSETITGRIAARVIDIKPNGTLVLEARKYTRIDQEELTLIISGTCRTEDITIDNTILSSQLYGLYLDKQHTGELRKASKKGMLTRIIEFLFNF